MTATAGALCGVGFLGCRTDADDSRTALRDGTGTEWVIEEHPVFETVSFALPKSDGVLLPSAASPADAVLALLDRYEAVFGMHRPSKEWRLLSTSRDEDGATHLRFRQQTRGVSVFGSDWIAVLDREGRLVSMSGVYVPGVDTVDLIPKQTEPQISGAVVADVRRQDPRVDASLVRVSIDETPFVYAAEGVSATLAFRATSVVARRADASYLVDAHTGAILLRSASRVNANAQGYGASHYPPYDVSSDPKKSFPASPSEETSGSWVLAGMSNHGVRIQTSADIRDAGKAVTASSTAPAETPPADWIDDSLPRGAAVDAQTNFALVVDAYMDVFGRNSFDDKGADVIVAIDPAEDQHANAYWLPSSTNAGDCWGLFGVGHGDPSGALGYGGPKNPVYPLGASFTVVAHEFTHAVTQCTWGGGPGAASVINEAMSDILAMFLAAHVEGGNPFLVGRGGGPKSGYLRNLSNPHDPASWFAQARYCDALDDFDCQVEQHTLSTIVSYAWFLMTLGGKHATNGQVVPCPLGWEASRKLWWAVETQDLPRGPDFKAVANATLSVGKRLGLSLDPIACAWVAVRVVSPEDAKKNYDVVCPGPDAESRDASSSSSGGLVEPSGPLLCPGRRPLTGG